MENIHKKYENLHLRNLDRYDKKIQAILKKYIDLIYIRAVGIKIPKGEIFDIKKYPVLIRIMDQLGVKMQKELEAVIVNGVSQEWQLANQKNDEWFDMLVKGKNVPERFFDHNPAALQAFIKRVDAKMNLSKRVWKLTKQYRLELEAGLQLGISSGKSAATMATEMKQYLKEPDKLFRRVRDQFGKLQLSKAAASYHPGRGVYRSSFQNARRLTLTETNMAYRASDHERWKRTKFILGYEVKLSNNHPVPDICNLAIGRYPKEFKFVGFHPRCRCVAVPIRPDEDTMGRYLDSITEGEDFTFTGQVEKIPQGLKTWTEENKDRIKGWKSKPYFIKDNPQFLK